ncbi:hypothetical protein M5K25_000007 [Dendrobium thyrsiflorum]|uniref:Uncharacterized protein n=1 Tax=Dendrobium thyrsiflorum TaxID=117978 RepID=A0ABD0VSS0_DENTH
MTLVVTWDSLPIGPFFARPKSESFAFDASLGRCGAQASILQRYIVVSISFRRSALCRSVLGRSGTQCRGARFE